MATRSATRQAFQCQEILSEIFEHLEPGRPDPNAPPTLRLQRRVHLRTLARLARVSHSFSVPALSVLWRVMDNLVAILSVLPSFRRSLKYPYVGVFPDL